MKIVSMTPIKLNNVRLPGKNVMPFGPSGKPLCSYLFEKLLKIKELDERYVFCSDDSFREYVPTGITFLKRDASLNTPQTKGLDIIAAFLKTVEADIYVLCHVTAPFILPETISSAITQVASGKYDSAFTAEFMQDYCWYKGKPLNYDMTDIITTQNLEPVCVEKGEVFIFTHDVFQKYHQRIGKKPFIQEISEIEAVDIDTPEDFKFAQNVAFSLK